jgi:endonuclease/exonuclease/phosphatase family metal-dependent hydrolase
MRTVGSVLVLLWLTGCTAPAADGPTATPALPTASPSLPARSPSTPTPVPTPTAARSESTVFASRPSTESLRVMTYNVNWDSIFPEDDRQNHDLREFDRGDAFGRIVRAVRPDVLCLQEVNHTRDNDDLSRFLADAMDSPPGETWQVAHVRDTLIATRFGLQEDGYRLVASLYPLDLQQAAARIDLPDDRHGTTDLYVICAHFKSGGSPPDISSRSRQADVIASNLRDLQSPGGDLDLPAGTPIVILGDFNIYTTDPAAHARTLQTGDISNEAAYGADVEPDWDGTDLADAHPSHNGLGVDFYTWRTESPLFPWGALDRIFYTDSVLEVANAFILNTELLSDEALERLGLTAEDVILDPSSDFYDHLPLVADFVLAGGS